MPPEFLAGLDLGQAQDYTALAIVEKVTPPGEPRYATINMGTGYRGRIPVRTRGTATYQVRHLERPELHTTYPAIVERVKRLLATEPLAGRTKLIADHTGVGRGVVDMFKATGVRPVALSITGGDSVTWADADRTVKVPKRELVGALTVVLQTGRLKVAESLALAPTLVQELVNFKVKIDPLTAHDSYGVWRENVHDDLVLAVAMAVWYGEHPPASRTLVAARAF